MATDREACGRCSASVTVDAVTADYDADERAERDPFGDERIEVEERQLRSLSPDGWISRVSSRLDDAVGRFTWRR